MDVRILLNENSKLYHLLTLEMDGFDGACFAVQRTALENARGVSAGRPGAEFFSFDAGAG